MITIYMFLICIIFIFFIFRILYSHFYITTNKKLLEI